MKIILKINICNQEINKINKENYTVLDLYFSIKWQINNLVSIIKGRNHFD